MHTRKEDMFYNPINIKDNLPSPVIVQGCLNVTTTLDDVQKIKNRREEGDFFSLPFSFWSA